MAIKKSKKREKKIKDLADPSVGKKKDLPLKTASADKTRGGQRFSNPKTFQILSSGSGKW